MILAMIVVLIVLSAAMVVVLAYKYIRTRDRGFIWLGVALVIWPLLISPLLNYGVGRALDSCAMGECVNLFPFMLVQQGAVTMGELVAGFQYVNQIVSVTLGVIAISQLYRNTHRDSTL